MGLQTGSSVDGSYSVPLIFAELPKVNQEGSQWTECEIKDTINLIYENLQRLDSYLSVLVRIYLDMNMILADLLLALAPFSLFILVSQHRHVGIYRFKLHD